MRNIHCEQNHTLREPLLAFAGFVEEGHLGVGVDAIRVFPSVEGGYEPGGL